MDGRRMQHLFRLLRIWRDKQSHHVLMLATYGPRHCEVDKAIEAEYEARVDLLWEIG